ncbi:MAG: glycosyltransferase family 4 protein [Muribaculum sp.]|nr:glycosyltransferase family 4 protein [Muribaculum sp.]
MKILVVSNMYPSTHDKVYGVFVKGFVDGLKSMGKGNEIELTAIRGRRSTICGKIWAYIRFYLDLTYRLLFKNYDIVYVHTITFTILPIRLALWFRNLPLAFNVHGDDVAARSKLKRWLRNIAAKILPNVSLIVSPTHGFKQYTMSVIHNLNDNQFFVSPSAGVEDIFFKKRKTIIGEKRPVMLGFVSRINSVKGWDLYLQALNCLKREGINFRGVISGNGEDVDKMKSMIDNMALNEYINYLGRVDHDKLPELYHSLDLLIFPTRYESLGLVGLEAMAAGVPVIASDIFGPNEYIKEGENGFLIIPDSVDDLVRKIKHYILLDHDSKQKMSELAISTANEYRRQFTHEKLYTCLIERFS